MPAIRDLDALVGAVLERSTGRGSRLHGEHHWQLVGWVGMARPRDSGVDPEVVFLFALFHDSMREHDGDDPGHGKRGAQLANELYGVHHFASVPQTDLLVYACNEHTGGELSDDPTIAVCWDADRLNLWRVGTEPDPAFLLDGSRPRAAADRRGRAAPTGDTPWAEVARALASPRGRADARRQRERTARSRRPVHARRHRRHGEDWHRLRDL